VLPQMALFCFVSRRVTTPRNSIVKYPSSMLRHSVSETNTSPGFHFWTVACVPKFGQPYDECRPARRISPDFPDSASSNSADACYRDTFAEILRRELDNPLTGILGNAALVLAEARWQKLTQLPEGNLRRLETIATLAVRMRETMRRLSQTCKAGSEQVRPA